MLVPARTMGKREARDRYYKTAQQPTPATRSPPPSSTTSLGQVFGVSSLRGKGVNATPGNSKEKIRRKRLRHGRKIEEANAEMMFGMPPWRNVRMHSIIGGRKGM